MAASRLLICSVLTGFATSFTLQPYRLHNVALSYRISRQSAASRYGPPIDGGGDQQQRRPSIDWEQEEWERQDARRAPRQSAEFRELLELVMITSNPDHLPSLLTKHMELLLSMPGDECAKLVQTVLDETKEIDRERVEQAIDYILSFAEEFADQAKLIDEKNKKLLGKIIRALADKENTTRDREEMLDELMQQEKHNFSRGFLRHLEGECDRIASAPQMTPQSSRLLEILRIIQARVLEELGKDLGDGALVLGQLLGYDDKHERLAILDAGLTVRGVEFAFELADLTDEALKGFEKVPGGVDPGLIECIKEVDERVRHFITKHNEFL